MVKIIDNRPETIKTVPISILNAGPDIERLIRIINPARIVYKPDITGTYQFFIPDFIVVLKELDIIILCVFIKCYLHFVFVIKRVY